MCLPPRTAGALLTATTHAHARAHAQDGIFATYKKQDFYDYHRDCDIVQPLYRKLSVTVQLSGPETYKGGDLFIRHFWGKTNLPIDEQLRSRGTIIVFPSLLLHSVRRVIRGTRYSLVQWYSGPDFV